MGDTTNFGRRMALVLSASGIALSSATAAWAQEMAAQEEPAEAAIVVTGSRVVRDGMDSPTPVTVLSAQELSVASPSTIAEGMAKLPQFANSPRAQMAGFAAPDSGSAPLNLRGLGPQRTLTLLDGRRIVPSTSSGATDVNLIPEGLVQRVDIVTGGASAAYGSDAVAGVVNFVLDTSFTGLRARAQAGVTSRGENASQEFGLSFGTRLGERAHLILSADYFNADGIDDYRNYDWFRSCAAIVNPLATPGSGQPARVRRCGVQSSSQSLGGMITAGPLAGNQFLPGGVFTPVVYGDFRTASSMVGGSNPYDQGKYFQPLPAQRRINAFGHFKYDLGSGIELFADAMYGTSRIRFVGTLQGQYGPNAVTIYRDNAYLPQSVRDRMIAADLQSFTMSLASPQIGMLRYTAQSETWRASGGLRADLGSGWRAEAYYTHGENNQYVRGDNHVLASRVYAAVDAVNVNGQTICQISVANPNSGCVPINLFGGDAAIPDAARNYLTGSNYANEKTRQDVVEATISGDAFSTWAGPVSVGGGYRREFVRRVPDPLSAGPRNVAGGVPRGIPVGYLSGTGPFALGSSAPISGSYNVWETFGEVLVPLAEDVPTLLHKLDLNAAIRYTNYSTSGGVTTWKGGLTWQPVEDLRLRITRSRDIRAPNVTELFQSAATMADNAVDPFRNNATSVVTNLARGNTGLGPERADTLSFGAVFKPRFLPGFSISADYFDIQIKGAIGNLGVQNIINQCFAGATSLCPRIVRDVNNVITQVDNSFLNISAARTRGIDLEASYQTRIGSDTLSIRALATNALEHSTQLPGAAKIDRAGQTGIREGLASWNANLSVTYATGPVKFFVMERFQSAGVYDATFREGIDIDSNRVRAAYYTDATVTFTIPTGAGEAEMFFTANNLFDQAPPEAGNFFIYATRPTNPNLFDVIGRSFVAGARIKF